MLTGFQARRLALPSVVKANSNKLSTCSQPRPGRSSLESNLGRTCRTFNTCGKLASIGAATSGFTKPRLMCDTKPEVITENHPSVCHAEPHSTHTHAPRAAGHAVIAMVVCLVHLLCWKFALPYMYWPVHCWHAACTPFHNLRLRP